MGNQASEQKYNIVQNKKIEKEDTDYQKSDLVIARILAENGFVVVGEKDYVKVYLENTGDMPVGDLEIETAVDEGVVLEPVCVIPECIIPGEIAVCKWSISSAKPLQAAVNIAVFYNSRNCRSEGSIKVLFIDKYDEKKLYINMDNKWINFGPGLSLQKGNNNPLSDIPTKTSRETKSNMFGVTAHIPRDCDEEDPFNISHLIDGNNKTGWASRSNRVEYPTFDEWVMVWWKKQAVIDSVGLLPYWKGSGFPVNFDIEGSLDGQQWILLSKVIGYELKYSENQGFYTEPVRFKFDKTLCRMVRIKFYKLSNKANDFFCRPVSPYQVRLSCIEVYDGSGHNILYDLGEEVSVECSSTDHAWYNTVETINKTWPMLFDLGVKWNRIGQWGDKCEWATIEKEKGVYKVGPAFDKSITESVQNGVNIMLTLGYGNNLYQERHDPWEMGPVWEKGHPHFQTGPSSEEGIQGFVNYCRFMVRHFKDRIKHWEIWNEENGWFHPGSNPVKYGRLLKLAAEAIKEEDPEAIIISGGIAALAPNFLEKAFEQGAGPYVDIVAFHPYGKTKLPESGDGALDYCDETGDYIGKSAEELGIRISEDDFVFLRKLLSRFNDRFAIWENEMNWCCPGDPPSLEYYDNSELSQAKYLARFFIINHASNVGTIWWSLYNENYMQEWAIVRSGILKRNLGYFTLQRICTIFDDSYPTSDLSIYIGGGEYLRKHVFRNTSGQYIIAVWNPVETKDDYKGSEYEIIIENISAAEAEGVDLLYGFRQKLEIVQEESKIIISRIVIGDYPVLVRLQLS